MSKLKKTLSVIYYLVILLMVLILYSANFDIGFASILSQKILSLEYGEITITLFSSLVVIISFIKIITTVLQRTLERYFTLFEDSGNVSISDTAINKVVENSLNSFDEVLEHTISTKIRDDKNGESRIIVNIKCGLNEELCRRKGYYEEKEINLEERVENQKEDSTENNKNYMSINDFCNKIQRYVHSSLEKFLSLKVEQVNIKFYDIKQREDTKTNVKKDNGNNSSKSVVNNQKNYQEKKKRVN